MKNCLFATLLAMFCCLAGAQKPAALAPVSAVVSPIASQAAVLGAARAGKRLVSVGDHGTVMLSDDEGVHWRQAKHVPVNTGLTAVSFADSQNGWAVGHGGAILATTDGGENWALQRWVTDEDRPLFSVHFFDAKNGVAVGLWSLVLTTDNAGKTWIEQKLPPPPGAGKADANLLQLFADRQGVLYAVGERGLVLRSSDRGLHWDYLPTGGKGSLWSGLALADGSLLVGGQRGAVYLSTDGGNHWKLIDIDSKSSVTSIAQSGDNLLVVGLDGLRAVSKDGGRHFAVNPRPDRVSITAALPTTSGSGKWLTWSRGGLVEDLSR